MKILLSLLVFISIVFAINLKPTYAYKSSGSILDLHKSKDLLYSATDQGIIDIFNLQTNKLIFQIKLPTIKDFMNDDINAKIYSIDLLNKNLLLVSQGSRGYTNIFVYKNKILTPIITHKNKLLIKKARYISKNEIMLALISNELILYNLDKNKIIWKKQINSSRFSDFALNDSKSKLALTDESGKIFLIDTVNGDILNVYNGQNVDNVFQIDYKNDKIAGAGQDRRLSFYDTKTKKGTYKKSSFYIYSVGLSPSANRAAYSSNEENCIDIIHTDTLLTLFKLKAHNAIITKILFFNENEIFTGSDDQYIYYWKLR